MIKEEKHPIHRIVLTGGPCSGKTTAMAVLVQELSSRGFGVVVVREAATDLITGGISPDTLVSGIEGFQFYILDLQRKREVVYLKAAIDISRQKPVVILYDRGQLDGQAYVEKDMWNVVMNTFGVSKTMIWNDYDAIVHMVTAADGAESHYTTANNEARSECPHEAKHIDALTQNAWVGHPHLRVIDNSTGFEEKIARVKKEIFFVIGHPEPVERELKYHVARGLTSVEVRDVLSSVGVHYEEVDIRQVYLSSSPGSERRLRVRGQNGQSSYFYTVKRNTDERGARIEHERCITPREFMALLCEKDARCAEVIKKRFCFLMDGIYYEYDVYASYTIDGHNANVLEVETEGMVDIPKNLIEALMKAGASRVNNVTGDDAFSNRTIAIQLHERQKQCSAC